jgi:hypothetical protein
MQMNLNAAQMQVQIRGQGRIILRNGVVIQGQQPAERETSTLLSDGPGWIKENASREHILLMQSNWDLSGSTSKVAALIDRATGKAVWDSSLKTEQTSDGSMQAAHLQLFDGGLVLFESRGRTAFTVSNAAAGEDEFAELAAKAAKAPDDAGLRMKLALANYERGAKEKALQDLAEILATAALSETQFAVLYGQLARLRKDFALQHHALFKFKHVDRAPDLKGGTEGWENVPESALSGWSNLYLASEDPNSHAGAKKEIWRGPGDLSATFKGAYDEKNLYLQIAVKDDQHSNDQTAGSQIDFGDAVTLAFDVSLSGGIGYRGECYELAFGMMKNGSSVGARRLEHGRYLRGQTPYKESFRVTRNEADKLTLYQIALPLGYLGLKAEPGVKFGFTFAVQDQDATPSIEKSLCASPGLIGTREPRYFSQGVFETDVKR